MFTTTRHLGDSPMSEKDAAAYKELKERRRASLLMIARKMKLKVESASTPASHVDLVDAIARKKGWIHA